MAKALDALVVAEGALGWVHVGDHSHELGPLIDPELAAKAPGRG